VVNRFGVGYISFLASGLHLSQMLVDSGLCIEILVAISTKCGCSIAKVDKKLSLWSAQFDRHLLYANLASHVGRKVAGRYEAGVRLARGRRW